MNQDSPDKQSARVPAKTMFYLFSGDFADDVVVRACEYSKRASPETKQAFKTAVKHGVKVRGFNRDSSAAPAKKLAPEVSYQVEHNDKLARAVLQVWSESQQTLRKAVVDHLRGDDVPVQDRVRLFKEAWTKAEWHRRRDHVCGQHADLDKNDVALMLCLASGIIPAPEGDEGEFALASPRFQRWLDELDKLPFDAPEWIEAGQFGAMVATLAVHKREDYVNDHISVLRQDIEALQTKYESELRYLDIDTNAWLEESESRPATLGQAQALVLDLKDELKKYQPIRPQAPVREEEQRRSVMRAKYEKSILKVVEEWREVMSRAAESIPGAVGEERATYQLDGAGKNGDWEKDFAALGDELALLKDKHVELEAKCLASSKERDQASEAKKVLQLEKTQLNEQIAELKSQLAQGQQAEETWRQAYVDLSARANVEADAPVRYSNADDAIAQAEKIFAKQLAFAPNGKSPRSQPFQKPEELFNALAWLATEYHRLRPNPGPSPNFDLMIRKACPGWTYKPNQTDTTMGMYSEWYQTTWQGKRFELSHHIGKGNGRDPKNTIRIAFDWDEEHNRVVVGYIGLHQRNRQS